jgi:hypothetical protein
MHQATVAGVFPPGVHKDDLHGRPEVDQKAIHRIDVGPLSTVDLYGDRAPRGLFMLLRIIVITAVSVITPAEVAAVRWTLNQLEKGDFGSRFSKLQISEEPCAR